MAGAFAVIQTATIAAVGWHFPNSPVTSFRHSDIRDENILYQVGSWKMYPAQFVSIALIILLTFINTKV